VFAFSLFCVTSLAQVNPVPTINSPVSPEAVTPGSSGFALTIRGAGFVPGVIVNWNGAPRATTFISAGEIQAQVSALDVAVAGSALVTVTNPSPGGGTSSSSFGTVVIHQPIQSVMLAQPLTYRGNKGGFRLFTADLNGDSKQDLIQVGEGLTVFLGNGDGTFTRTASIPLATNPEGVSFGDFNGDGNEDFSVAIYDKGVVIVALGDGTGKFHTLPAFGNFTKPIETAAGDFNRDGKLDLLVAASDGVYIFLGNGDGTFQPQRSAAGLFAPDGLTPADFNGDGILDLALVDGGTDLIAVLLGNGDGTFQPPIEIQQGDYLQTSMTDFNHDGIPDSVVVGSGVPVPIGILLGNGAGSFQPPQFYSSGLSGSQPLFTVGDFNADGNIDILAYDQTGFLSGFLAGNGDGTFQRVARITMPGPTRKGLAAVGDFNSDGLLDFAISINGGSEIFLQAAQ
jgi:hypothetical protein